MDKTKQKSRFYFFFFLIFTFLVTACGVKNYKGFVAEDARFANYTFLDYDNAGLAYYVDETNPNNIAVGVGTCEDENITVSVYTEEVDGVPTNRNVTSVFPSGFQNCTTIKRITLPDTVTTFGTDAFAGSSLETITIPKNLTAISSGAFRNCKDLTSVRFKTDNLLTTINDYAFANCYNLEVFSFHEIKNLSTIGKEAFLYCPKLTSVVFPEGFVSLESYAFQDCKGLTTIYFPASTAYVAANAFRGVGLSAKIYFSEKEPGSGSSSSSASSSITPVSLAEDFNFSYGDYYIPVVFDVGAMKFVDDFQFITPEGGDYNLFKCNYGESEGDWSTTSTVQFPEHIAEDEVVLLGYTGVTPNAELNIPAEILGGAFKVVGIKSEAFLNKTNIKKVTFHENLRFIDYGAFSGCTSLTDIDLRGAVDLEHIQSRAFYNTMSSSGNSVDQLYSVHIPSNVQNIEGDAFRKCKGLFKLYFDGATNELEEAFLCTSTGSFTFELGYVPSSISSVTFDGPAISNYTAEGSTITITNPRQGGVARVKYTTNNTTTQTFKGQEDDNNTLITEFVLAGNTDDGSIGSVTVGDVLLSPTDYSIVNADGKSKIVFDNAPADGATIVVSYRAQSKLTKIQTSAFYGCSNGFGDGGTLNLRYADNPFSHIYFPASLNEIGKSAFRDGQFIGGVTFNSSTLDIKENAFSGQKALSSIDFPDSMTSLTLRKKCFAYLDTNLSHGDMAAGNMYKKLISVTLPQNTTVAGSDLFHGHLFVSIYCIGAKPSGISSNAKWNRTNDKSADDGKSGMLESFGSFSSNAIKNELDYAPVYTVDSADDIITLPSKDYPIFDLVKEQGNDYATLTNYHYYGGRIKDQNGDTAITMGYSLTTNNTAAINTNYNSEYVVRTGDGHFKFVIPYQVTFDRGTSWKDVKKIGKAALAVQFNSPAMHPRGCGPTSNKDYIGTDAQKYWFATENFWTMKEIYLPNSITTIDDIAMAFVPFTTVHSYKDTGLSPSSDGA
ncbi:MAG: leucine-rich repeat protein, partial [Bacilli bacterium]|nr:leucine-rich repeat protein [Bacilli bacterium]